MGAVGGWVGAWVGGWMGGDGISEWGKHICGSVGRWVDVWVDGWVYVKTMGRYLSNKPNDQPQITTILATQITTHHTPHTTHHTPHTTQHTTHSRDNTPEPKTLSRFLLPCTPRSSGALGSHKRSVNHRRHIPALVFVLQLLTLKNRAATRQHIEE